MIQLPVCHSNLELLGYSKCSFIIVVDYLKYSPPLLFDIPCKYFSFHSVYNTINGNFPISKHKIHVASFRKQVRGHRNPIRARGKSGNKPV